MNGAERPRCAALSLQDVLKHGSVQDAFSPQIELLYGSGLRVSELCGLDIDDLDLGAGAVTVMGKGRKQRRVPLSAPTGRAIEAYLAGARAQLQAETGSGPALFLGVRGKRIDPRAVRAMLSPRGGNRSVRRSTSTTSPVPRRPRWPSGNS